MIINVSSA